ncbi:Troponin I-like 1 [Homarus americanus]|uniref:Troponin I-like 1 n=1 Tax=Homarus americanus TaxID=6706 RepID=A0A8J5MYQ9_HOMAM|nr:Troponin I-like 1 [Homarus americanus]
MCSPTRKTRVVSGSAPRPSVSVVGCVEATTRVGLPPAPITRRASGDAPQDAKKKQDDIDRRKAEVRKRLEEQSLKKQKKGFMTPERKKKLRLLLRKKAAEELKKEQERKAAERRKIIDQRCGQPKNLDGANEGIVTRTVRDPRRGTPCPACARHTKTHLGREGGGRRLSRKKGVYVRKEGMYLREGRRRSTYVREGEGVPT